MNHIKIYNILDIYEDMDEFMEEREDMDEFEDLTGYVDNFDDYEEFLSTDEVFLYYD